MILNSNIVISIDFIRHIAINLVKTVGKKACPPYQTVKNHEFKNVNSLNVTAQFSRCSFQIPVQHLVFGTRICESY